MNLTPKEAEILASLFKAIAEGKDIYYDYRGIGIRPVIEIKIIACGLGFTTGFESDRFVIADPFSGCRI